MPDRDRLQLARDVYDAYESGDRSALEELFRQEHIVIRAQPVVLL